MNRCNSISSHCLCVSMCPPASGALCVWAEGPGSHAECIEPSLLPSTFPLHTLPSGTHLRWHCSQATLRGVCVFSSGFPIVNIRQHGSVSITLSFSFFLVYLLRFPTDPNCQTIDRQFLWGSSLLISPVLERGAEELAAYLPPATWYSLHNVSSISIHFLFVYCQRPCLRFSVVTHDLSVCLFPFWIGSFIYYLWFIW